MTSNNRPDPSRLLLYSLRHMKKEESDVIEEFQFEVDTTNTREKQRDKTLPATAGLTHPIQFSFDLNFLQYTHRTTTTERRAGRWVGEVL
mmetsp:Transcript_4959/g.5728  ORF Transcript_4959/g.5728 Transcript_4959/m.5728 type:complete len:90 (-) Transcript_4959:336-605(-)